uniref:NB-ARC domain-containing protein n=1 Tax=Panagrellus redivivus TaxID=6233 RepID=A0A7E4UTP4_PANRE
MLTTLYNAVANGAIWAIEWLSQWRSVLPPADNEATKELFKAKLVLVNELFELPNADSNHLPTTEMAYKRLKSLSANVHLLFLVIDPTVGWKRVKENIDEKEDSPLALAYKCVLERKLGESEEDLKQSLYAHIVKDCLIMDSILDGFQKKQVGSDAMIERFREMMLFWTLALMKNHPYKYSQLHDLGVSVSFMMVSPSSPVIHIHAPQQ